MRHITRYEYCRTRGWKVRVAAHPQTLFSDGRYGGRRAALAAARAYLVSLPPADLRRVRYYRKSWRNTSGRVGVSPVYRRGGTEVRGWRVVWCEPVGVVRSRNFLVSALGSVRAARAAAVAFREAVERRLAAERAEVP